MKEKIIILAFTALMLFAADLSAQQEADYSILSFDLGYGPGYDLNLDDVINTQFFGINIRVAGPLAVGIFYTDNAGALKIKYDIFSKARLVFGYGSARQVKLGMEYAPFKREIAGLYTEFKIAPEYSFDYAEDIGKGKILFGLLISIGI